MEKIFIYWPRIYEKQMCKGNTSFLIINANALKTSLIT